MVPSIPLLDRRPPERAAGADQREAGPGAADRGPACRGPAGWERPAGSISETPNRAALSERREPAGGREHWYKIISHFHFIPLLLLPTDVWVLPVLFQTPGLVLYKTTTNIMLSQVQRNSKNYVFYFAHIISVPTLFKRNAQSLKSTTLADFYVLKMYDDDLIKDIQFVPIPALLNNIKRFMTWWFHHEYNQKFTH